MLEPQNIHIVIVLAGPTQILPVYKHTYRGFPARFGVSLLYVMF